MDDLANNWGTRLALSDERTSRSRAEKTSDHGDGGFAILKTKVAAALDGQFHAVKPTTCGSDANAFALLMTTEGNLSSVMIANGSYVSGTLCGLQNWSTSNFSLHCGPSTVRHPQFVTSQFTKDHTVGLPYHIPGTMSVAELEQFEDDCCQELHVRLVEATIHDRPFGTLFMELLLGGCGAILSDRALLKIATLAERHGFTITLDKILTGGHDGCMVMVMKKPERF